MLFGFHYLLLFTVFGSYTSFALQNGEDVEPIQEDASGVRFGQSIGHRLNNKINTIDAANRATKAKYLKSWNKAFAKHFGGKRSIFSFPVKDLIPKSQTSRKWDTEFGKLLGGQKLRGDYSLGARYTVRRQGDSRRRLGSNLLQQWNRAYEKNFGKPKSPAANKYSKEWSKKYNSLFG